MEFLQDLYRGTIETDSRGRSRGMGLGAAILKPFVDERDIELGEQQAAVESAIVSLGEDPSKFQLSPEATVNEARGAVVTRQRERARQTKDKDRVNAIKDTLALQQPQLTEQTAARREANQIAREGNSQQMQLAVMQMQDNADQRIAELEYQKSRDRKEDMQYNERMEELDRKDRRAMMQNMAMGLASLGAAFAL